MASGKGGVGKSTVSANLSCALAKRGANIGLLDCDIYGPSIPLMMGVNERPAVTEGDEKLVPLQSHGVKLMSMGFLLQDDQPVIWRGPMIMKTIQQFVMQVDWGVLDYLLVDLPPGTGDAQLSLCQTVPLDGGVIEDTLGGPGAGLHCRRPGGWRRWIACAWSRSSLPTMRIPVMCTFRCSCGGRSNQSSKRIKTMWWLFLPRRGSGSAAWLLSTWPRGSCGGLP